MRVTVAPAAVTVDYVRSFLPGDGTNGSVAYTYGVTSYQFRMLPPRSFTWRTVRAYATGNTYTWTTAGLATGSYRFQAQVRRAGLTKPSETTSAQVITLTRWRVFGRDPAGSSRPPWKPDARASRDCDFRVVVAPVS